MAKEHTIAWDPNAGAVENARSRLPLLAAEYFDAGRKMLGGKHSAKAMHKFRLRTKYFRYTLELFRDVYGTSLEKRLEMLKPVQDALGDLNDCASARELLANHSKRHTHRLHTYLKQRAHKKVAEFEECWRTAFDAPGESEAWLKYLAGAARAK